MPFNPLRNEIDKIHLQNTGKTSEQLHSDILRSEAEISAINALSTSTLPTNLPTKDIEAGISNILTGDISLNKAEQSFENKSFWEKAGELSFGDLTSKMIDADIETKNNINSAVGVFKKSLLDGSLEESQKALGELKDKFNRIANSTLSNKDKNELRKSYADIVEKVNQVNTLKLAQNQLDSYYIENNSEARNNFLKNFNTNQRLPLALKSAQTTNSDIINKLSDLESNRIGSKIYNTEDLNTFKSTYVKTDDDLYAGMEMQYNYAMKTAVDKKIDSYQQQIAKLDEQIQATSDPRSKNLFAQQKSELKKDLEFSKTLSQKLNPYLSEDNYLKNFYPEQYTRKKDREKQEVYRNQMLAEGDKGSLGETIYRAGQQTKSNFLQGVSGLAYLAGNEELGYRIKSGAEYAAPPTFFVGKDLNKNNKIDDSEITRDIHGNKVTMSQVSWTDKNGNTTWNLWAPVEQVLPIATDVLMTIALSKGVGAIGRGVGLTYGRIGAAAGLSEAGTQTFLKQVAPRIATFGNVTATTFPRFYAEERSNFKNGDTAFKVALLRAGVEGLTETVIPDTELFSGKIAYGALDPLFAKLGKFDPTELGKLTMKRDALLGLLPKGALSAKDAALLMAPASVRRTLSGAAQESIEELGSLVGNYFVDKYASRQNFEVEETNKLTSEAFLDTFVEGFIPSLFISGGTNLLAKSALRQERLNQARWNIANNPEKYKQVIANQVQEGKLTKEEGLKRTAAVDNLGKRLDSMTEINHIKSLTNLLDDKDKQYAYFSNKMFSEDLLTVDTTQLSEEQLQDYQASLDTVSKELLSTKTLTDKYAGLEEADKKAIISKLFDSQAKAAESADTSMSSLLAIANQTNASLLSVPVTDERYSFVAAEYKKFQDRVNASIATRIENFSSRLENKPEDITSLELSIALNEYIPAIERLNASSTELPAIPTPLMENLSNLPQNAPELIQAVRDELNTRGVLNQEEFIKETSRNLNNPETKGLQSTLLAVAELSDEELNTGELNEEDHAHLTKAQIFNLGAALEQHAEAKKKNPQDPTFLEQQRDASLNLSYNDLIKELDNTNKRAAIIELNKKAIEYTPSAPVVNNFSPAPTVDTTPAPQPTLATVPGDIQDIDQDIYDQYASIINALEEMASNPDEDVEELSVKFSKTIKETLRSLDELKTLNEVRSALLGMYPIHAEGINQAFEKASQGISDISTIPSLTGARKSFIEGVISKLISEAQTSVNPTDVAPASTVTNDPNPTDDVIEEAPDLVEDSVVESDNYESAQDAKNKEVTQSNIKGQRGLHLATQTVSTTDQTLQDPAVILVDNIITSYSESVRSGKSVDLNVRIQSVMGLYEFILDSPKVERLKALQQESSLTDEQKEELKSLLTINGVPLHNSAFISYIQENPSKIGSGVATTFVDTDGNLIRFTKKGKPSVAKTSVIAISTLPNKDVSPKMAEARKLANEGKIVTSLIDGVVSGFGWNTTDARPLEKAVGETIYVHTDAITRTVPGADKNYTLNPGSVHLFKEGARNPYTGVSIPTNGNSIQSLVNAFNEGKLPETLDESIRTNAVAFLEYMSQQVNSTFVKTKEGGAKDGMRYFKKANLYLTAVKGNRILVEYPVKGKNNKTYIKPSKNQQEDLLKIGESSYKLVSARLVEQNQPYKALVVKDNGAVETKTFNTYTDFVKSSEFGATFVREENRSLSFSPDWTVINPVSVDVVDVVNNNIPAEPITVTPAVQDIKADIEKRRQEELESIVEPISQEIFEGDSIDNEGEKVRIKIVTNSDGSRTSYIGKKGDLFGKGDGESWVSPEKISKDNTLSNEEIIKVAWVGVGENFTKKPNKSPLPTNKRKDKVNAKYDAELAALDQPTTIADSSKISSLRDRLNSQGIGEDKTDPSTLFRVKSLQNRITRNQNEAAKTWVANHPIFKNTSFIFDNTIKHPEAYALWSKAGIFLFEGANYAEAYHEAWHEFSQLYLTPDQKTALYTQARSIYGDIPFVELEEKLAEDFRSYALTGGKVMPEAIANSKESNSIFKQIWDFITNLFTDKKTVDHYFSNLYKGNLIQFKRKESNTYFKQLFSGKYSYIDDNGNLTSLSYKDSKGFLDDLDSIYVNVANTVFKDKNATFVNIVASAQSANSTYSYMASKLLAQHDALVNEYNRSTNPEFIPVINDIRRILEDFNNVASFHKQNSSLFNDSIRKNLIEEQIKEIETANTEFASFEASVNEMSQKQLASEVLINALRTLPKYENGEIVFHPIHQTTPLLGEFNTNWNILQRRLSGSNSYEDLYSRVEGLTEEYPQFNQFLTYLPNPSESIDRVSSLNFKNEFFRIFSMPYVEGYTTDIKRNKEGEITEVKVFKAQSLDSLNVRKKFDTDFSLTPSNYSKRNTTTGTFYLDTEKYFATFPAVPIAPKDEEEFEEYNRSLYNMLTPLGFNLSPNAVDLFVREDVEVQERRVNLIYNKLKSLAAAQAYIMEPLSDISSDHVIDEVKIAGENSNVSAVVQYEVEANPQYVNDMRYNAAQKQIWSVNQHTFMTKTLNVLNDSTLYPTLDEVYAELPHLNPKNNPNAKSSFVIKYLFNEAGKRIKDKYQGKNEYRRVELGNLLGINDVEGEKTIDSNENKKHYADIIGLIKAGVEEINRLSGKSTTRGLVLDRQLRFNLGLLSDTNQADPFAISGQGQVPQDLFYKHIVPLIEAEVQVTLTNSAKFKISPYDEDGSPKLSYFHKIFTPEQRTALLNAYKSPSAGMSFEDVFKAMPESKEISTRFGQYLQAQANRSKNILGQEYALTNAELMKYHFFSALGRIEQHKLFFGHPYYYKNAKDIEKRLSAWNAFGSYATLDEKNLEYLESGKSGLSVTSGRDAFHAYAQSNGIKVNPNRAKIDQISYLVLKDENVKSLTAAKSKAYGINKEAYTSDKKSAKQDAAAFCTIDFFRKFYSLSTGVTPEMMAEFKRQDSIYKKYLELQSAPDYAEDSIKEELEALLNEGPHYKFTIKKLQYSGHNSIETGESIPVFHKYSMKPILPSEMVDDSELAAILQKMHASSADYAVFESGTKISETVEAVSLFDSKGKVKSQAVPTGVIDFKYLKEQVLIENKEDFNNLFSTQFRKLIYKDAESTEALETYNEYKSIIENLTNFDKLTFLEQLEDKERLVEFLIREISKKNAAESTKDLLKLKEDNTLMHTLDSMIDRTIMESAVVASVKNNIIKQKVPGAQRVQYPVSLIRPNKKLAYYDIVKDAEGNKIRKAETIVSFSKGYYPLLNLLSPVDNEPIGELDAKGKPVNPYSALKRLNEALKDPQFKFTYASQLSMVAIRIPGQGYNSMENFEIVEFLPEESGEIILVPDEMTVKSGSDYDIDKLFCYDTFINKDGSMVVDRVSTPEGLIQEKNNLLNELKELREEKKIYKDEKKALIDELQILLNKNGFDGDTRLRDLYKELKSFEGVSSSDLVEAGITDNDLELLKKKFSGELVPQKVEKSRETSARISAIRRVLSTASKAEISDKLTELNKDLNNINNAESQILQELKALRGGYTNALLLNIANRLSQPEIFESLITPNAITNITSAVEKYGSTSDATTASLTNLINPIYQLYVFSLNTYKTSLGTDAKNNVFHSLLQKTTFYREDERGVRRYLLESNRTSEGFIDFSRINNVDGKRISLITGQLISAHVDIEKNDGIAQIGLNNVITPVVNYTIMAGSRFTDIVNLINKPVQVDGKKMRSSILTYSKGKSVEDILESILETVPKDSLEANLIENSRNKYGQISKNKFISNVYNQMYSKTGQEILRGELFTREDTLSDLRRFAVFLELEDQTSDLATVSLATDYDTFSPQNFESFRSNILDLIPYTKKGDKKNKIFNEKGLSDIINNTIISPYQVQQDVLDKFVEVFPISANPKITNTILRQYALAQNTNRRLDYDRFSRIFKNDLLYTLFLNNVPQAKAFESFLDKKNPGNLSALYLNLKSRLANRGITAENDIFELVKINSDVDSSFIRTGLRQTELDYSVDVYKEEFEKGFNWAHSSLNPENSEDAQLIEDMQGFFKAFAYAGILGTQLNKKFDSYLPLIPESIYTLPMSSVIPNFVANLETEEGTAFIDNFISRFKENHRELYSKFEGPKTMEYYKDYDLSRENIIQDEVSQSTLTKETSEETSKPSQLQINFQEETDSLIEASFANLREINNNLSKNC